MNLPPSSLKFLRLAIDPASSDGEIRTSAYQFVRELRRCGFLLPPEAVGAGVGVFVAHGEGEGVNAAFAALREQKERILRKAGIVPIGAWKNHHVSEIPTSHLFYFQENTAELKPAFREEVRKELEDRGAI